MKKILLPLAAALAVLGAASANAAGSTTSGFNVRVDLTATCTVVTAPSDVQFTYTSMGAAATATGGNFTVKCTNSLPYNFSIVGGNNGSFTAVNLNYTLGFSPAASGTGNGNNQNYQITGSMAAGQGGTCNGAGTGAGGACQDVDARTLTVSF